MVDMITELCRQICRSADYMRKSKCLTDIDTVRITDSVDKIKNEMIISLNVGQNYDILTTKEGNENSGRYPRGSGDDQEVEGPNGTKIIKKHNPNDYSNVQCGSSGNKERTETGGMSDKHKKKDHIQRHSKDLGIKPSDYEKEGAEFLSKPLGKTMEEITLSNGKRYRYDYKTNWFGVANKSGNLSTVYAPDDGAAYWEDIITKEGQKK